MPLYQALMWLQQCVNYYLQTLTALWIARFPRPPLKPSDSADVVGYLLNSACVLFCTPIVDQSELPQDARQLPDGSWHVFSLRDFVFFDYPACAQTRRSTLRVLFSLAEDGPRVHSFVLDDRRIDSASEQLGLVMVLESIVVHPMIHSFHEVLFYSASGLPSAIARRISLHGAFLNAAAAWLPSWVLGVPIEVFRAAAHQNAVGVIPRHSAESLRIYLPFSRLLRFLVPARAELYRLCRAYDLKLDIEAFFLCSVMHSVDHYCMSMHVLGRSLTLSCLPACAAMPERLSVYHLMFIREAQYVWPNKLRDHAQRHPFFQDLYRGLRPLDAEIADHVTLSISY